MLGSKKRGEHWPKSESLPKQGKLLLSPRKDALLPESKYSMKLTYQKIMELQSLNRGWNSEVLDLIGVEWPPKRGWIKRITDTEIDEEVYKKALSIRDSHLKPTTRERLEKYRELRRNYGDSI